MKIDGFQLHQLIRSAKADRDQATAQFTPSLFAFTGEDKPSPSNIALQIQEAEARIARLQTIQDQYNLSVKVLVGDKNEMSLAEAIKLKGGLSRMEALWRKASIPATIKNSFNYNSPDTVRKADDIVASRQISYDDAANKARSVSNQVAALQAAIAKGNAQDILFIEQAGFLQTCIEKSKV